MSLHDAIDQGLTALMPSRSRVHVGSGNMGGALLIAVPLVIGPLGLPIGGAMMYVGRNDREGFAWRGGKVVTGIGAATAVLDIILATDTISHVRQALGPHTGQS